MDHRTVLVEELPLTALAPDPDRFHPFSPADSRDQRLIESLQQFGLLQPLVVHRVSDDTHVIVDGHRRYEAAKKTGLTSVPCRVHTHLRAGDAAVIRFALRKTIKPWTQAEFRAWRKKVKGMKDAHGQED